MTPICLYCHPESSFNESEFTGSLTHRWLRNGTGGPQLTQAWKSVESLSRSRLPVCQLLLMPLLVKPSFPHSRLSLWNERSVTLPSLWQCAETGASSAEMSGIVEGILYGKGLPSTHFLRGVSACKRLLTNLRVRMPWISLTWIDVSWDCEYWERSFSDSESESPDGILQSPPLLLLEVTELKHCLCLTHCGQRWAENLVAHLLLEGPEMYSLKLPPSAKCPELPYPIGTHTPLEPLQVGAALIPPHPNL